MVRVKSISQFTWTDEKGRPLPKTQVIFYDEDGGYHVDHLDGFLSLNDVVRALELKGYV